MDRIGQTDGPNWSNIGRDTPCVSVALSERTRPPTLETSHLPAISAGKFTAHNDEISYTKRRNSHNDDFFNGVTTHRDTPCISAALSGGARPPTPDTSQLHGSTTLQKCVNLRTTTLQKCAAVPRRARIQGSWTFVSLTSRLESNKEEDSGRGEDQWAAGA